MTLRSIAPSGFDPYHRAISPPSDDGVMARLGATAAEMIVIPSGAKYVRLVGRDDFYTLFASTTGVATVAADTTDGTASELFSNQKGEHWRYCSTGNYAGISVISPTTTNAITASFYTE